MYRHMYHHMYRNVSTHRGPDRRRPRALVPRRAGVALAAAVTGVVCVATSPPAQARPARSAVAGSGLASAAVPQLPWRSRREGLLDQLQPDTSALGTLVSTRCNGGAPVLAVAVSTWTPAVTTPVYLEQVTTMEYGHDLLTRHDGLAVLRADGSVAACLAGGGGVQRTPRLVVPAGAGVRIVQFVDADVVGYPWAQTVLMVAATGLSAPRNDTSATATRISALPLRTQVDNRLATTSPEDWVVDAPPNCVGAFRYAPQVTRSVWFQYVPPVTQTVLVRTTATSASPLIAERTASGLRWLPGSCALEHDGAPQTLVDTLLAGHTYLLEVGNWSEGDDTTLLDSLAPQTLTMKAATPTRPGLAVTLTSGGYAPTDGVRGTVTCQAGRTFLVQGRVARASNHDVVETFTTSGTCTGTATPWTASLDGLFEDDLDVLAVAAVTSPSGSFVVVGPATGTTTG